MGRKGLQTLLLLHRATTITMRCQSWYTSTVVAFLWEAVIPKPTCMDPATSSIEMLYSSPSTIDSAQWVRFEAIVGCCSTNRPVYFRISEHRWRRSSWKLWIARSIVGTQVGTRLLSKMASKHLVIHYFFSVQMGSRSHLPFRWRSWSSYYFRWKCWRRQCGVSNAVALLERCCMFCLLNYGLDNVDLCFH